MDFQAKIFDWYKKNKRNLPWRDTKDPYKIWLSEIILQQTRVNQGLAYYHKFIARFPSVQSLAEASEDEVLNLWKGLGYYSRARNLHKAAMEICAKFGGKFPQNHKNILSLKGVGAYTAAAIASFAFGQCYPVVDGNVLRVLSRFFSDKTPIDSSKGKKHFTEIAEKLISKEHPALFNQAMMELGALVCMPQNPDCVNCPLNSTCEALQKKQQHLFPVKEKKIKKKTRHFYYLHIFYKQKILIRKRTERDIWQHLHDFPLIENETPQSIEKVINSDVFRQIIGKSDFRIEQITVPTKHILTHQTIFSTFIKINIQNTRNIHPSDKNMFWIDKKSIKNFAVPRLVEKYLLENS